MTSPDRPPAPTEPVTCEQAVQHAARLLSWAETETDHARMERLEKLADSWISLANLLASNERA